MKKNFKLVLALVLAAMMIVASIAAVAEDTYKIPSSSDLATGTDLGIDASITVSGLDEGDTVKLYRVMQWEEGTGWVATNGITATIPGVSALIANTANVALTQADVEAIVANIKAGKGLLVDTNAADANGEYSYATNVKPGMYVALVNPANPGVVYNPIVISADFTATNDTSAIDASTAVLGTSADYEAHGVAKRKDNKVVKTEPKITNDVNNSVYHYTITTTIPTYADSFTNPYFQVVDTLSDYLFLDAGSLTIKAGSTSVTPSSKDTQNHSFTLLFDKDYISQLKAPQTITIEYDAKLHVEEADKKTFLENVANVDVEKNEVTVQFPNNPDDDTDATVQKDGTREYTFTIDGNLLGSKNEKTNELVKVAQDASGEPIVSLVSSYLGNTTHAALEGAVFGVYTKKTDADAGNTNYYKNDVFPGTVTTDAEGRMQITGLNAGVEYYLKELTAPAGYIKDQKTHTIYIDADITEGYKNDQGATGEEVTEWYKITSSSNGVKTVDWKQTNPNDSSYTAYKYYIPVLNSYTVMIDSAENGGNLSTYSMALSGTSTILTSTVLRDTELVNTKGVELPSTGGIGTTIFYVGGSLMVLAAAILLITKRRMGAED